jgi:hypothetical protein
MDGDLPTEDFHLISSCPCWAYTNGCTGQISAVTFCAKTRTKAAIKNLLGEPGVRGFMLCIKSHRIIAAAEPDKLMRINYG